MKQAIKILGYVALFLLSFLFFLWSTFPYEVLKESISNQLSAATSMNIRIGKLGPRFPLGIRFGDISISPNGGPTLLIKQASASLSPLALLIGKVSASAEIVPPQGESLEVSAGIGLLSLIKGGIPMPKSVEINSNGLPIGPFVDFFLALQANSPTANPLVTPILKQIAFNAKLVADIDLALNADQPTDSSGRVSLVLKDATLAISGASQSIPNQAFETAKVEGNLAKAIFAFKEGSGLKSGELSVNVGGNINLKQEFERSALALSFRVELRGPLKDNFGFILDAVSGGQSDGKIALRIDGTVALPNVTPM